MFQLAQRVPKEYIANKDLLKSKLSSKIIESINFINDSLVLKYLINQGLIGYDYTDYISPDPYSLTSIEYTFVQLVNNHQEINNPNYRLPRVERVVRELNQLDYSVNTYKYAYSPDVLTYFVTQENKSEYVDALIDASHKKNQPEFILATIESLMEKGSNLTRLLDDISKVWSNYYKDVFNSENDNLKRRLARQLLNYLSNSNSSNQVFNSLKDQKIFENSEFEDEFVILNEDKINKIFKYHESYDYSDLTFVSKYSLQKLKLFMSHGWYEENNVNFKIIFDRFANHNLNILLNDYQKNLNISNKFIQEQIFNYYSNEKNATYEDLATLIKYVLSNNHGDNSKFDLETLNIYLATENKFDKQSKKHLLLNDLNFVDLINKKQFIITLFK